MIEEYINQLQEENRKKLSSYDSEMQELTQELSENEKLLNQLEREKQDDKNIFSPRAVDSGKDLEIQKAQDQIRLLKQQLDYVSQMVETEVKNQDEYHKLAEEAAKETVERDAKAKDMAATSSSKNIEQKVSSEEEASAISQISEITEMKVAEENASEYENAAFESTREVPSGKNFEQSIASTKQALERENSKDSGKNQTQSIDDAQTKSLRNQNSNQDSNQDSNHDNDLNNIPDNNSDNGSNNNQDLVDFLNTICKKVEFSVSLLNGNKNRCRSELKNVERMILSYEDALKEKENS